MSQALVQTKKRMKSVTQTSKITKAMKLVSTVKLRSSLKEMEGNKVYSKELSSALRSVYSAAKKDETKVSKTQKKLYVVTTSSLGLCGAYNHNIFDFIDQTLTKDDECILLGTKGIVHYKSTEFKILEGFEDYQGIKSYGVISRLTDYLLKHFLDDVYSEIDFIYTEYKNSITFIPRKEVIFPLTIEEGKESYSYGPILEPDADTLLERLIPLYAKSRIYSLLLESEVSEQASRRNAMENATDNAEELAKKLQLEFNKARQAAITQEIIEISAARI